MQMDDELSKIKAVADQDQALAGIRTIAGIVATYFNALREKGVDHALAEALAVGFQEMYLATMFQPKVTEPRE